MTFWQKIKQGFRSFMSGRYGSDALGRLTIWVGLALYVVGLLTRVGVLLLLPLALYGWTIFRMFSRNVEKRRGENNRYLAWRRKLSAKRAQLAARLKNRKEFHYFKCPQCRSLLRLPRGVGEVTVTCGKCQNKFQKKG